MMRSVLGFGPWNGISEKGIPFLQGYEVFGMFMRNWDARDEAGDTACSANEDYQDTLKVCNQLG